MKTRRTAEYQLSKAHTSKTLNTSNDPYKYEQKNMPVRGRVGGRKSIEVIKAPGGTNIEAVKICPF